VIISSEGTRPAAGKSTSVTPAGLHRESHPAFRRPQALLRCSPHAKNPVPPMKNLRTIWAFLPVLSLLAANSVVLFGVVLAGWDAFAIVLFYWTENIAVGFYNVLKMALVRMPNPAAHLAKLFMIPFFIIHFGGFTAVHGIFVLSMFNRAGQPFSRGPDWPCFLAFVQLLLNAISQAYAVMPPNMKFAALALFISHGISFLYNYLIKAEYASASLPKLMGRPYARVVVMHVAIIAGGFVSLALGSPVGLLLILVLLKTIIDVRLHFREHRKMAAAPAL